MAGNGEIIGGIAGGLISGDGTISQTTQFAGPQPMLPQANTTIANQFNPTRQQMPGPKAQPASVKDVGRTHADPIRMMAKWRSSLFRTVHKMTTGIK